MPALLPCAVCGKQIKDRIWWEKSDKEGNSIECVHLTCMKPNDKFKKKHVSSFVVYHNSAYLMVHRHDCRHVQNRRATDKRYIEMEFLTSVQGLSKTVCYCRHCKPRSDQ